MKIPFHKYHGTGNDFIIINGIKYPEAIGLTSDQIEKLCDRHFGIGADGLMILTESDQADFKMIYYNSDGKTSSMCGNGGRCIAKFSFLHNISDAQVLFEAFDGNHQATVLDNGNVNLEMINVAGFKKLSGDSYEIQTGSPHYVQFTSQIEDKEIVEFGKHIRYSDTYKAEGINVNTASLNMETLEVRTYERGVEDETLSCGTGVTAAALCATDYYQLDKQSIQIQAKGGKLEVAFRKDGESFTDIRLIGPAEFVFEGEITSATLSYLSVL